MNALRSWSSLNRTIIDCRRCPRLVEHREKVARDKRRQFESWEYWGRPVTGFGDPDARVLIVGLAPAAHGGNRTGRVFTGDRSGDWLYAALHEAGFANQPTSTHRDDGLRLHGAFVTAVARCPPPGNRPLPEEIGNCRSYLVAEIALLKRVRAVVALGQIAMVGFLRAWSESGQVVPVPRPRFAHGAEHSLGDGKIMLVSYHPSQQNTFTGKLTRPMFRAIFERAAQLVR